MTAFVMNGSEISTEELRRAAWPMLLPRDPTAIKPKTLERLGVAAVVETRRPTISPGEIALEDGVEEVDGKWRRKWRVAVDDRPASLEDRMQALETDVANVKSARGP